MKKILETLRQKWPEYLLEMIVIIASIIGAFMLESWNEDQNRIERENATLLEIVDNLETDIERIPPILKWYDNRDSIANIILQENYDKDSARINLFTGLFIHQDYTVASYGFEKLSRISDISSDNFQEIMPHLKGQYGRRTDYLNAAHDDLNKMVVKTLEHYQWNYSWYSNFGNEESLNYFRTDPEFKNFIKQYRILGQYNFRFMLQDYWTEAVLNYYRINRIIDIEGEIPSFIPKNDLPVTEEEKLILVGRYDYDGITVAATIDNFLIFENYQEDYRRVWRKTADGTFELLDRAVTITAQMDSSNAFVGFKGDNSSISFPVNKLND